MIGLVVLTLCLNLPLLFQAPYNVGLQGPLPFYPDEGSYASLGQLMASVGPLSYLANPRSLETMLLWPSAIALFLHLPNAFFWLRLFSELCIALGIAGLYWLGLRLGGRWVGLGAAGLALAFRPFDEFAPTILTEPLFSLLFIAMALGLVIGVQERRLAPFWAAGTLLFLANMVRPVLQLLPLFLILAFAIQGLRERKFREWFRASVPFVLVFALLVGYGIRNAIVFHKGGLCNGSGAALYLGSRYDTEGDEPPYRGRSYGVEIVTGGLSHVSIEGDRRLIEAAKDNIRAHPLDYAWWGVKKIGRLLIGNRMFWTSPYGDALGFARSMPPASIALTLWGLLLKTGIVLFGLWGLFWGRRRLDTAILAVVVGYYVLMHMPVLVNPRYGIPLIALLCATAALGVREVPRLSTPRRVLAVLALIALGIVSYEVDLERWARRFAGFSFSDMTSVKLDLGKATPAGMKIETADSHGLTAMSTQGDPQLVVSLPRTMAIRKLAFDLLIKSPSTLQVFYADSISDISEAQSLKIPVTPEQSHYDVVFLPGTYIEKASQLRIDPVCSTGSFTLRNVSLND